MAILLFLIALPTILGLAYILLIGLGATAWLVGNSLKTKDTIHKG